MKKPFKAFWDVPPSKICKNCYHEGEFKCDTCHARICDEHMIQDEDGSNRVCLECEKKQLHENQIQSSVDTD